MRAKPSDRNVRPTDATTDGIPRRYYQARVTDRGIDEFIGLCRGLLADGMVSIEEVRFLFAWLDANPDAASCWPANEIHEHLRKILHRKTLGADAQEKLLDLLMAITGGGLPSRQAVGGHEVPSDATIVSMATSLPLSDPPPNVVFAGRTFCFTGTFVYGRRKNCELAVIERGGFASPRPTKSTNYLVIGSIGTESWIHSTHGRKIETAVTLRDRHGLEIISEQHWSAALCEPVTLKEDL